MAEPIDWGLAQTIGERVAGAGPAASAPAAQAAVASLTRLSHLAVEPVADRTGLQAATAGHTTMVVDRAGWISSNLDGFATVLGPVLQRLQQDSGGSLAATAGSKVAGMQAGAVLGWVAGKVLGQYEVFVAPGESGRLLLVAPNIVAAERQFRVPPRDFRLWVCLHEETHRVQFTAVPWLPDYFRGEVEALLLASETSTGDALRRAMSVLGAVLRILAGRPDASIVDAAQTAEQREIFLRLTALMSLLEGHAEFVMDAVGPDVIPSIPTLRAALQKRRDDVGAVDGLLRRLLGMDAKMRQYADGRAFVTAVVDRVGIEAFNTVWQSPQTLPLADEIGDPARWVQRVLG